MTEATPIAPTRRHTLRPESLRALLRVHDFDAARFALPPETLRALRLLFPARASNTNASTASRGP